MIRIQPLDAFVVGREPMHFPSRFVQFSAGSASHSPHRNEGGIVSSRLPAAGNMKVTTLTQD